jgi:hypothetical protein
MLPSRRLELGHPRRMIGQLIEQRRMSKTDIDSGGIAGRTPGSDGNPFIRELQYGDLTY